MGKWETPKPLLVADIKNITIISSYLINCEIG